MSRWPPQEEMRERILRTAERLFYEQGIQSVGVDAVAAEIGISKRTLYNHFPSKEVLVLAYLNRRFDSAPLTDDPPEAQILATFDRLERVPEKGVFRGCAFVNAVAEGGDMAAAIRPMAIDFKEQRRLRFRDLLQRLGVRDPELLATQLALLLDGTIAAMLIRGDPAAARAAKLAAQALIIADGAA